MNVNSRCPFWKTINKNRYARPQALDPKCVSLPGGAGGLSKQVNNRDSWGYYMAYI